MIKEIRYKGITRVPSDVHSWDGELEEMINVHNDNGELKAITLGDVIGTIDGSFVYVHKNAGYEHFIAIKGNEIKAYDYAGGEITSLGTIVNIYGETLRDVQSVGNILIILTDKEVKYALWKSSNYLYLGNYIPFPVIRFSLSGTTANVTDDFGDSFQEDFNVLRATDGWAQSYISDYERLPDVTKAALGGAMATYIERLRGVSEGTRSVSLQFENKVKGRINSTLATYTKNKKFVFPFFIRYALRMYDGTLVKHSPPLLMLPTKLTPFHAGIKSDGEDIDKYKVFYRFFSSTLNHQFDATTGISNFEDLITSVDIFISAPIYTYVQDGAINGIMDNPATSNVEKLFGGIYFSNDDTISKISDEARFYKVASIPLSELASSRSSTPLELDETENVTQYELMSDDYFTHDKISAESAFTYNHRLHLSGIQKTCFPGFAYANANDRYDISGLEPTVNLGDNPYVFYPNHKAKYYYRLYKDGDIYKYCRFELSPHKYLNGAFYLDPNLNDITLRPAWLYDGELKSSVIDDESNKLYVSAHQNPFVFPASSRLTLPVGRIITMASNTEAISQGQFGQFPLYVFTDDGIWALEVNQEGKYLARQPVSRDVITNNRVLQMDKHIAFITEKGLMILSGTRTECISDIISDKNTRLSKLDLNPLLTATGKQELDAMYNAVDVETFLANCSLGYEYINERGRIYAINPAHNYAYVFDIKTKTWGKVKSSMTRVVNNYPDCYVQEVDGTIRNLSSISTSTDPVNMLIVTRPITNENQLFTLRSFIHRGMYKSTLNTVVYASRNGIDYTRIGSTKGRHFRKHGTPWKYFKVAITGTLEPGEVLAGATIDITPKFTNRLR